MVLKEYTFVVACCQVTSARCSLRLDVVQFPPKCTSLKCLAICFVKLMCIVFILFDNKIWNDLCFVRKHGASFHINYLTITGPPAFNTSSQLIFLIESIFPKLSLSP